MGIGERIRSIWRSRTAGSPESLAGRLDASYREQSAALQQVRRGLADLSTQRRRVELRHAAAQQQAADASARAAELVAAGDDEGARASLTAAVAAERSADDIASHLAGLVATQERLERTVAELEARIEDFRGRKDTLAARETAARAQAEVLQAGRDTAAAGGALTGDLADAERRVREAEATAAAYEELEAEGIIEVEARLRALTDREEGTGGSHALPQ